MTQLNQENQLALCPHSSITLVILPAFHPYSSSNSSHPFLVSLLKVTLYLATPTDIHVYIIDCWHLWGRENGQFLSRWVWISSLNTDSTHPFRSCKLHYFIFTLHKSPSCAKPTFSLHSTCWWASKMVFPCPGKQSSSRHGCASVCVVGRKAHI